MDEANMVRYLHEELGRRGLRLPETAGDEKAKDSKVGEIGSALGTLMEERCRRFADTLMIFDGRRYSMESPEGLRRIIAGFLEREGVGMAYRARSVDTLLKMVLRHPGIARYEPRRDVVYCRNRVLVLFPDGRVETHAAGPEWMSDIVLEVQYMECCRCPEWEKFLSTVVPEPEAVRVLQEFLGAMFIDKSDLSVETAMFLYGIGSNGKSVIAETLGALLGENMSSVGLSQINGGTGDYYAAHLRGKLLAYNSDEEAKNMGSGRFKQMVSKEKMTVRTPYGTPYESDDWPMFMANINKSIITTDSSDGFWRRNKVIRFSKRFVDDPDESLGEMKADRTFKSRMLGELPGILNWILAGRARLLAQRGVFTVSEEIERTTAEMRSESTAVFAFLSSKGYSGRRVKGRVCVEIRLVGKDLYDEYRSWCSANGYGDVKNVNRFKNDMEFAGAMFKKSLRFPDGSVTSGYVLYQVMDDGMDEMYGPIDDLPL